MRKDWKKVRIKVYLFGKVDPSHPSLSGPRTPLTRTVQPQSSPTVNRPPKQIHMIQHFSRSQKTERRQNPDTQSNSLIVYEKYTHHYCRDSGPIPRLHQHRPPRLVVHQKEIDGPPFGHFTPPLLVPLATPVRVLPIQTRLCVYAIHLVRVARREGAVRPDRDAPFDLRTFSMTSDDVTPVSVLLLFWESTACIHAVHPVRVARREGAVRPNSEPPFDLRRRLMTSADVSILFQLFVGDYGCM